MTTSLDVRGGGVTAAPWGPHADPVCVITFQEAYLWASVAALITGYRWKVTRVRLVGWTARPTDIPLTESPAPLVSLPSPRGGGVPPGA